MLLAIVEFIVGVIVGAMLVTGYAMIVAASDLERMHRD